MRINRGRLFLNSALKVAVRALLLYVLFVDGVCGALGTVASGPLFSFNSGAAGISGQRGGQKSLSSRPLTPSPKAKLFSRDFLFSFQQFHFQDSTHKLQETNQHVARSNYSAGKRQKENERARKRKEKAERKRQRSEDATGGIPIATAEELQGLSAEQSEEEMQRAMDAVIATNDGEESERRSANVPSRLFVGGLSWGSTDQDLRDTFAKCGTVTEAIIITDRDTGDSRGFGFVTMQDRRDAAKAIEELNGFELNGRNIVVKAATERPSR